MEEKDVVRYTSSNYGVNYIRKEVGKRIFTRLEYDLVNGILIKGGSAFIGDILSYRLKSFSDEEYANTLNQLVNKNIILEDNYIVKINNDKLLELLDIDIEINTKYLSFKKALGLDMISYKKIFSMCNSYDLISCDINESGIYLIGNFYIGRSKDIKDRMVGHTSEVLSKLQDGDNLSKKDLILTYYLVNDKSIDVSKLSDINTNENENEIINCNYGILPLTNVNGVNKDSKITEDEYVKYQLSRVRNTYK